MMEQQPVKLCKCGNPARCNGSQRYCLECQNANARKHWANKILTPLERKKMNCRAYLKVYVRRGKVQKLPCAVCGDPKVQAHHDDYDKPLQAVWLCKAHHLERHGGVWKPIQVAAE